MMSVRRFAGAAVALAVGLFPPSALVAQSALRTPVTAFGGVDGRGLWLGDESPVSSIQQISVPLAILFPVGPVTVDIGTTWAETRIGLADQPDRTFRDFTDTQVRATWVFGRDAFVATLMVNLPTGVDRLTEDDQLLLSTVSSSFLAFPVNSYGNGTSATAGLAWVTEAGPWNLGVALSGRFNAEYTPFVDRNGPFTFQPGVEGRLRVGADRLLGSSRLAFGLTGSTFRNDEFRTGGGVSGLFRPGSRLIAEASWTTLLGSNGLTIYAWDFYRAAGDSAGRAAANSENLFSTGGTLSIPISPSLVLEPTTEFRLSSPEVGRSYLVSAGSAARVRLGDRLALVGSLRVEAGELETVQRRRHSLRGWTASVIVRRAF